MLVPRQGIRALLAGCAAAVVAAGLPVRGVWAAPPRPERAQAAQLAPAGWRIAAREGLAPGLTHQRLEREGTDPQVANIARLAPGGPLALRAVLSNERLAGGSPSLERTSSMCARWSCLLAVNADFALPGRDTPVGGLVAAGELVRSPNPSHHQVSVRRDGTLTTGRMGWHGVVVGSDLQSLDLTGVNVDRGRNALVLYTPRYGPNTAANRHGVELVAQVVEPSGPILLGRTTRLRVLGLRAGKPGALLRRGQVVLSGHGRAAQQLRDLWGRIERGEAERALLTRLDTDEEVVQSVGGTPVLVRNGKRWVRDDGSTFVNRRHPRTLIGWAADGTVLLVTVDGRQPGRSGGLTLAEAADLMISLGAREALNLDGGGSTTFVTRGRVRNRPSDRLVAAAGAAKIVHVPGVGEQVAGFVERPVVSGLVVVPRPRALLHAEPAPVLVDVPVPEGAPPQASPATDPGSNPLDALPHLVLAVPQESGGLAVPAGVAAVLLLAATAAGGAVGRRRVVYVPARAPTIGDRAS